MTSARKTNGRYANEVNMEIKQYTTRLIGGVRGTLTLIPPLADEFKVYGDKFAIDRARKWALFHRYMLADGVPACAHGMYLMGMCPAPNESCIACMGGDHTNLWVPADFGGERPFLLTAPYPNGEALYNGMRSYAWSHGLRVHNDPKMPGRDDLADGWRYKGDDWYGAGTIPFRLGLHDNEWPMLPIEAEAAALLPALPVRWPEDTSMFDLVDADGHWSNDDECAS